MRERYLIGRLTQNWTTWSGIHFQSIPTPSSLFALKTRVSWTFSKSIMITNRTRTYPSRYPCIYRYQRVPPEMRHHRGLAICAGWGFCSKKLSRLHERLFRPSSPPPRARLAGARQLSFIGDGKAQSGTGGSAESRRTTGNPCMSRTNYSRHHPCAGPKVAIKRIVPKPSRT